MEKIKTGLREKKSAETKEKIYRIAELLFKENGLENVSPNSIISHASRQRFAFLARVADKNVIRKIEFPFFGYHIIVQECLSHPKRIVLSDYLGFIQLKSYDILNKGNYLPHL